MDVGRGGRAGRWGPLAGAALFYCVVTAIVFALELGDRAPDARIGVPGDRREFLWNAWWIDRSLLALHDPWRTDLLFAPFGTPLVWHSLVPLQSTAMALLARAIGPGLAYDAVVVAAFPLAGTGAWALCRHMTRDGWASLVGGLVFMLCPFVVSKTMGHLNLLYCGLLPVFYVCLLRAVEAEEVTGARRAAGALAAAGLAVLLASLAMVVFAANLVFLTAIWMRIRGTPLRDVARRFGRALAPLVVVTAPIVGVFAWYTFVDGALPAQRSSYAYNPEPLSYVLPLTATSAHRALVAHLASPELAGIEPVAYLGWAVAPLALVGLWLERRRPEARLAAALLAFSLVLSLGPKLLWQRAVVEVAGMPVYLPFGLWRWVPVLGAVGQPGRYLVIGYLMLGVGVAFALARVDARAVAPLRVLAAVAAAGLVLADYAVAIPTHPLPPMAPLAGRAGAVADLRLDSLGLYYQTGHGRPLVGGVISRSPRRVLEAYDRVPTLAWLRDASRPTPARERALADLRAYHVTDVCVDPGSRQDRSLEALGFLPVYRDAHSAVWSLPADPPNGARRAEPTSTP